MKKLLNKIAQWFRGLKPIYIAMKAFVLRHDFLKHQFLFTLAYFFLKTCMDKRIAFLIVLTGAIAKEAYDYFDKEGTPEVFDVVYSVMIPLLDNAIDDY